jgi:DNA-directed RNA polymerase specialized sigma24 family protein
VFDDVLAVYGREIQGVAYLILRNHADAEEIVMDTLVTAWKRARDLRDDRALRTWLLRIATRHALSRRRRERPVQSLELSAPPRAPVSSQPSLDRLILIEAMGHLAQQTRAAVRFTTSLA